MGYLPQIVIYRSWYVDKIEPMLNSKNRKKTCVMQKCNNNDVKYFVIDIYGDTLENLQEMTTRLIDSTAVAVGIICPNIDREMIYSTSEALGTALGKLNIEYVGGYFNDGRTVTLIDNEKK